MAGKYLLCTLGCKVNQYESQELRELVESYGLSPASKGERPDLAVVNTCAVTAEATRKNRQTIRRIARQGSRDIFVVGCGASAEADRLRALKGVTAVVRHDSDVHAELHKLLRTRLEGRSEDSPYLVDEPTANQEHAESGGKNGWIMPDETETAPVSRTLGSPQGIIPAPLPIVKTNDSLLGRIDAFGGHQRAFLKVQDGCDAHCTYCIIPQLRSTLRSKPLEVAVEEARAMVRSGHKEIVLTGIFLGAYGRETALRKRFAPGAAPLAQLVDALAQVKDLARLRLSSLEPGDVDEELLDVLQSHDNCVPHLHLPLQSGSPETLRRMNRQYSVDDFIRMMDRVRTALDRPAISTDIIVGFPGETEEDFAETMEIARYAQFCKIHAFPFSPRDKTAASRWRNEFIPGQLVDQRMRRLRDLERELSYEYRKQFVGCTERVIVENAKERGRNGNTTASHIYHGRSDRYFAIHFESAEEIPPGTLVYVEANRVTFDRTHGTIRSTRDRALPVLRETAV